MLFNYKLPLFIVDYITKIKHTKNNVLIKIYKLTN